jgi:2,4'-dihydroxyacetophenone dioxygenase
MSQVETKLVSVDGAGIEITQTGESAFFDHESLPWVPWLMEDSWFKLLKVNCETGGFTMFLKVSPNNKAPIHGHIGSVEGVILEGGFSYEEDEGKTGFYVNEPSGVNHKPSTGPDGLIMFAIIHGPLIGYNEDGSIAAVIDAKVMYQLADDANQAQHVEKPKHW